MNSHEDIATMFRALGDPTRLRIFNFLRSGCCAVAVGDQGEVRPVQGPTVGEVCCHITGIEKADSRISFHLKELRLAGLITMEKRGKYLVCAANADAIARLRDYIAFEPPCDC